MRTPYAVAKAAMFIPMHSARVVTANALPPGRRLMLAHALAHVDQAVFQVGEDNVVSRRAMANIGGELTDRTRVHERSGGVMVRHVIYEIDRRSFASGPLAG